MVPFEDYIARTGGTCGKDKDELNTVFIRTFVVTLLLVEYVEL
jgi:hypothetical protein